MEDIPQYQTTRGISANFISLYTIGIVGYKLCAGRLIEPVIVPPCTAGLEGNSVTEVRSRDQYFVIIASQIDEQEIFSRLVFDLHQLEELTI